MTRKPKKTKIPDGIEADWERIKKSLTGLPCDCPGCIMKYKAVFYSAADALLKGFGESIEKGIGLEFLDEQTAALDRFDIEFQSHVAAELRNIADDARGETKH